MGWQWHQLDHMQIICTLLQTYNHASTSPLSFYRPDTFPAAQPTASKHWRQFFLRYWHYINLLLTYFLMLSCVLTAIFSLDLAISIQFSSFTERQPSEIMRAGCPSFLSQPTVSVSEHWWTATVNHVYPQMDWTISERNCDTESVEHCAVIRTEVQGRHGWTAL